MQQKIDRPNIDWMRGIAGNVASWAEGLPSEPIETSKYGYFVDSYRLRLEDDALFGGGNLHGFYKGLAGGGSRQHQLEEIAGDFWVFCRRAWENDMLPKPKPRVPGHEKCNHDHGSDGQCKHGHGHGHDHSHPEPQIEEVKWDWEMLPKTWLIKLLLIY